ncbi:MAG: glycosyltransferase, partial [Candidatus Marinimicrobia bacterium]|nr:glycosyltransferase [Candidatus Neomarinimicrobiota bacterium]
MNIDISVVVPTYNRNYLLKKTLNSILNSESIGAVDFEILVIDNNSTDLTRLVVQEFEIKTDGIVRYILEKQQGSSPSRNRGIFESRGKYILFTDDDQVVDTKWMKRIYVTFIQYNADIVGGKIKYLIPNNSPIWLIHLLEDNPNSIGQLDLGNSVFQVKTLQELPKGGNMAFRKKVLTDNVRFDPKIGRIGKQLLVGEETKLLKQLFKSGKIIIYQPDAIIYHILEKQRYYKKYWCKEAFGRGQSIIISSNQPSKKIKSLINLIGDIIYLLVNLIQNKNDTFQIQLSVYRSA